MSKLTLLGAVSLIALSISTAHATGNPPAPNNTVQQTNNNNAQQTKTNVNTKMTTKQLNNQQLKNINDNNNNLSNDASNNGNSLSSDTGDFNAFSFAYQEAPLIIPQAVVGPTSSVLTSGIKVGPLFSYSWQHEHATPEGARQWRDLALKAYTNDGTSTGELEQGVNLAVLCAVQEEGGLDIPNQMNTECK